MNIGHRAARGISSSWALFIPLYFALALLNLRCSACEEAQLLQASGQGVDMTLITGPTQLNAGPQGLIEGDVLIESARLRALFGGLRRAPASQGALLSLSYINGGEPVPTNLVARPLVEVDGAVSRVQMNQLRLLMRDQSPVLRIEGSVGAEEQALLFRREVSLTESGFGISVSTELVNRTGSAQGGARTFDRVEWGGAEPFAPALTGLTGAPVWIGRELSESAALAVGRSEGNLQVAKTYESHGSAEFLQYSDIGRSPASLPTDDLARDTMLWMFGTTAAEAVRHLGWSRSEPFSEALVRVRDAPNSASLTVLDSTGAAILKSHVANGDAAVVPLTEPLDGNRPLSVFAEAYGHAPSDVLRIPEPSGGLSRVVLSIPAGGQIRVRVRDQDGAPLLSRVRILGVDGTDSPNLGPDHRASGALDTVLTASDALEVSVPVGRYRVLVTRGPEWSLVDKTVEVTETFRPDVTAVLEHVVDPGQWVASDLHVHAAPSPDSEVTLEDRVLSLAAEGIGFAIPTDHNRVTDYGPAAQATGTELLSIPGVEVSTWEPSYGHFNAFPVPYSPELPHGGPPVYQGTTPTSLFASLRDIGPGVLVQVNHPRMEHDIGYFNRVELDSETGSAGRLYSDNFDLLEVWNGFDLNRPALFEQVFSDWLRMNERGHRVVATGNSDSHKLAMQWAGYPRTYIDSGPSTDTQVPTLLRSLGEGRAFVSSGLFLEVSIEGAGPGASIDFAAELVRVHVRVRAPDWIDASEVVVYAGASEVLRRPIETREPNSVTRFDQTLEIDVGDAPFIVVLARGDRMMDDFFGRGGIPPLAFTNPVWLQRPADPPRPR